ncbi:hypothetical protein DL89DRAFT_253932 [Linderina pennispora]|uniref:Uncharacterized protein n=1 Tax=Linderina pennispora TaxID=61395 RepID=A0A1Y1WLR7_9FUNG|nr:uncharacterized protein DL89DRAFT_253932 [Linderina pennispora]ORX74034.1 hypothetical protein DL89DRAFT_253932 [Linderina pennispora]
MCLHCWALQLASTHLHSYPATLKSHMKIGYVMWICRYHVSASGNHTWPTAESRRAHPTSWKWGFTAGMKLGIGPRYFEADCTAALILELFPDANDLSYRLSKVENSHGDNVATILPDTSPLYEVLTQKYLHQLMYVQSAVPFPDGATSFSANLTKLVLDAIYITSLRAFPVIPTKKLVVVRIFRIFGMAPFWLFRHASGVVDLSSLEELSLDFIPTGMERVPFPGAVCSIRFGSLGMLKVCGSAGTYSWLYPALESNPINGLHISEDPGHFIAGGMGIISTAASLTIVHPTGTPHTKIFCEPTRVPL